MVLTSSARDYVNRMLQDISGMKVLILDSQTVHTNLFLYDLPQCSQISSKFQQIDSFSLIYFSFFVTVMMLSLMIFHINLIPSPACPRFICMYVCEIDGAGEYCERCVFTVRASSERSVLGGVGGFYFKVEGIHVASQGRLLPSAYIGEHPAFAPPACYS